VEYFLPPAFAKSWHSNNFYKTLVHAQAEAGKKYGIVWRKEVGKLLRACPVDVPNRHNWVAKRLQRHLSDAMLKRLAATHCVENFLGNRLIRWKLEDPIGILARRAVRRLHYVGRESSPCVAAQYWRMLLNGWCTGRRFQQHHARCVFGCDAEDSLEHYCRCKLVWSFLTSRPTNGPGVPQCYVGADTFCSAAQGLALRSCGFSGDCFARSF
jgi:hypothetical protein